jgi:hypothetical protein
MIATKANHKLGDVSREFFENDTENLCFITKEVGDNYIGQWITGFGLINVEFPKATTRDLTKEEVAHFNTCYIQLANYTPQLLKVD